jgi:hypothetical protein
VAGLDTLRRRANRTVKVSVAELLLNDSDPEFGTLTITGVSPVSVGGAAVSLASGWVFYVPPDGMNADDSFTYTVSDGKGATRPAPSRSRWSATPLTSP